MNLIGEHLDYLGGRCLSVALEQRTTATVTLREDETVRLRSGHATWEGPVTGLAPGTVRGWPAYVMGVLWALGVEQGLDIDLTSTLPVGAGLSSSAALACSVALALDDVLQLGRTRAELAEAAYRAETEMVGAPTGRLDQLVSLLARAAHAMLVDFAADQPSPQHLPCLPSRDAVTLMVIRTGERHDMTDGSYGRRRSECAEIARLLGVEHLAQARALPPHRLLALPGVLAGRARFVVEELARVESCTAHLRRRDWAGVGTVMLAGHAGARDDFEISSPEVDLAVEAASEAGAYGARMTGGGFGGCALAIVPQDRGAGVRLAVRERFLRHGWAVPEVFTSDVAQGAELLPVSTDPAPASTRR